MTKEDLFNKNTNIAYKITQHYRLCGIEYEDLKQICLYGLWKAVLTYRQGKGYAFTTYAYRVIQNEVNYYLRKNRKYFTDKYFSSIIYDNLTLEDVLEDKNNELERIEKRIDNENYITKIRNSNLKEREKQVLELLLQNYKQQQIAKIVGCSQPQVSRIIKKFRSSL